jgi:tRNA(Ile)-lysidine synthase
VGHTTDDQAETFLLKLMRGAGSAGLGGVYPEKGRVIRPLLDVSRDDLRRYLESIGQNWVEDESNADLSNPRNRLRHAVLPELDATYGGPTRGSIARAAGLLREDGEWLDEQAVARYRALVQPGPECLQIDADALVSEPAPLRRRLLLMAMRARAGSKEVGHDHVEAALAVLDGHARAADVPGSRWELRGRILVLYNQGPQSK